MADIRKDGDDSFPTEEKNPISLRLNELKGKRTYKDFAEHVQISESGVRKYFPPFNSIPSIDKAARIAEACGVELEWLATGRGHKYRNAIIEDVTAPYKVEESFLDEFALIDGYHVQVGAGVGQIVGDEPVRRRLAFRRKWLRYRKLDPDKLALVFAKGDSMEPTIYDNDTILVDTAQRQIVDGRIFVIRLGDELYAKRLQKLPDGGIHIISDNDGYTMLRVPAAEMPTLQVIGKVVWIGHDV